MGNIKKNYMKGPRREIIYLLHASGIITNRSLRILPKRILNLHYAQMKINEMKKEGILGTAATPNRNKRKFIYMIDYEKNKGETTRGIPEECVKYYETEYKNIIRKYWNIKGSISERGVLSSEVIIMMYASGIECTPDINGNGAKYFTSKEVKRYSGYKDEVKNKDASKQLSGSKAYGLIISKGGNYGVFNVRSRTTKWARTGELKFKLHLEKTVKEITDIDAEVNSAVVLVESVDNYGNLIRDDNKSQIDSIENVYEHVYAIPYDIYGRQMLEIMLKPEWKYILIKTVTGEYQNTDIHTIACDHYDKETEVYTFVFCVPDIKRYKIFLNAAMVMDDKNKFKIVCFDYQKPFIIKTAGKYAKIYSTSFINYYETIKP